MLSIGTRTLQVITLCPFKQPSPNFHCYQADSIIAALLRNSSVAIAVAVAATHYLSINQSVNDVKIAAVE